MRFLHAVRFCWLLLFLFVAGDSRAQKEDTALVNRLTKDYNDSSSVSFERALVIAQRSLDISERIKYKDGIALGLLALGGFNIELGNEQKASEYLERALAFSRQNQLRKTECDVLNQMGKMYVYTRDLSKAFSCYTQALNIASAIKDSAGMADAYMYIGYCLSEQDNFDEAIKNFNIALSLSRFFDPPRELGNLYSMMSATYFNHKDMRNGLLYTWESIETYKQINDTIRIGTPYSLLARCFEVEHKYDSSIYYYNFCIRIATSTGNNQKRANLLYEAGGLYADMNKFSDAEKYLKEAFKTAKETSQKRLYYIIPYEIAYLYGNEKDYKKAFEYLDTAYMNIDTLRSAEKEKALAEMTAHYNNGELEHKNTLLQKENDLQKLRLQRKNIAVYSVAIAALLLVVIGLQVVRHNKLLANQRLLEVEQKQLLSQMNPHFIFNCLNSIQQYVVQHDAENANRYLADFAMLMRQTLDNSKDGIIPLQREVDYLENYLSLECMRFENKFHYSIACAENVNKNMVEIPSMIIQPFAENAIHHGLRNLEAKEGMLNICFYKKDGVLFCEVDDNGIGMEESQKLKEQRFIKYQSHGIELTRQRLELVSKMNNGAYEITMVNKKNDKQETEGTRVIIKFPMKA